MGVQTLGVKAIALVGQVVLGWLLKPFDLGLVGTALALDRLIGTAQTGGIREFLVQRHRSYKVWANPAFWFSVTAGVVTATFLGLLSPFISRIYHKPELVGLILLLAVTYPVAAGAVATARLQILLRFRSLAVVSFVASVVNTSVAVALAFMGAGAYSIVGAVAATMLATMAITWYIAKPPIRFALQLRRWKYIGNAGIRIVGARLADAVISQSDFVLLGLLRGAEALGLYYFAFNLSLQTLTVLGTNLEAVLFPTLSRLQNEPARQADGFIRAARLLSLVAVPICFLQAAVADVIVHLLFPARWFPAILPLQLLSIGMAFRTIGWPAQTLMQSQGRFHDVMCLNITRMIAFVAFVLVGAAAAKDVNAASTVAVSVSIYFMIEAPVTIYIALKPARIHLLEIVKIFFGPVLLASLTCGLALYLNHMLIRSDKFRWLQLALISLLNLGFYVVAAALFLPRITEDLMQRVRSVIPRRPVAETQFNP